MFRGGDKNNTWKGNCEYLKGGHSKRWEQLQQNFKLWEPRTTSQCTIFTH